MVSMPTPIVHCFADPEALAVAVAHDTAMRIQQAIEDHGTCRIALAGGATPRQGYRLLVKPEFSSQIDWSRIHVFWSDERCVPPDHIASNYRMAYEALLSRVPIPKAQIHPFNTALAPQQSALAYAEVLGAAPLDIVLLGMGSDGHVASLFPDGQELSEMNAATVAVCCSGQSTDRVSLTLRTINEARAVCLWVSGCDKAEGVARVFHERNAREPGLPAARIAPQDALIWFLDAAAAGKLGDQGSFASRPSTKEEP